jgi:PAS domain S-box-containing protein
VAAVQFGPLILVGAPQYPVTLWRAGILWVVILGLVGLAVHRLFDAVYRKSAALAVSEAQFRTAFSDAPTGVALIGNTDKDLGLFLQVNRALAALLGRAEEELVNRSVLEFTHPDDRELTEQHLLGPPELQVGRTIEKRYLTNAGGVVRVKITYTRIETGSGGDPCVVAHYQDITDRRDAQPPLESEPAAARAVAPIDIEAVLHAALTSLAPVARRRDLAMQADIDVAGVRVWGDVMQVDRVVRSVLENAMRLTPPGGAIDAQARLRGDSVVLEVTESEGSTATLTLPVRPTDPV